jgi:hypothetical protein
MTSSVVEDNGALRGTSLQTAIGTVTTSMMYRSCGSRLASNHVTMPGIVDTQIRP